MLMHASMRSLWVITCNMAFNRDCLPICLQMQFECLHMQVIVTRIILIQPFANNTITLTSLLCHGVLDAAEIRDHAQSRVEAALQENNYVHKASINRAAMDVEQRCYDRATESDNAR